jgi:hypothetical protein
MSERDGPEREAHLQTLRAELEAERQRRLAAEAETVAARAASDELKLQVQRAGLGGPIRRQRLFRGGALVLLVLLLMLLAAAATVGIVHFRQLERAAELSRTRDHLVQQTEREREQARARARQGELALQLEKCRTKPCPICPPTFPEEKAPLPGPDGKRESPFAARVAEVLVQARQAYQSGQHRQARDLVRGVLRIQSDNQDAIRILGASSCAIKDRGGAKWALDRVSTASRDALRMVCRQYGIVLD